MIYVIDHQDSFTFNLVHLLSSFDEVSVTNYFEINSALDRNSDSLLKIDNLRKNAVISDNFISDTSVWVIFVRSIVLLTVRNHLFSFE